MKGSQWWRKNLISMRGTDENPHNRGEVGVIDSDKRGSSESSHQSIKDGDQVKYKDHKMVCSF